MKKTLLILLLVMAMIMPAIADEGFSADTKAINEAAQSVLKLEVYDEDNYLICTGSGFVAFNSNILVTNHHVMEDATMIRAYADDGSMYILNKVYDSDEELDIAILGFMTPTNIKPLALCEDFSDVVRASPVVAIGSPKGLSNTVSIGNISAFGVDNSTDYVQFTAPISSGSSGGALFNNNGEVIGITSWTLVANDTSTVQNLNFAVHIHHVIDMYSALDLTKYQFMDGYVDDIPTVTRAPYGDTPDASKELRTLTRGDEGNDVAFMQLALKALNYPVNDANGKFNGETAKAVRLFNIAHDISEAGIATIETQQMLYSGGARALNTEDPALEVPLGGNGSYRTTSDGKLGMEIEVENVSRNRTVASYELVIWARDAQGNSLSGDTPYVWMTEAPVAPGEKPYSSEVMIDDADNIYLLSCGVKRVIYEDGSVYIAEKIEYFDWDFSRLH